MLLNICFRGCKTKGRKSKGRTTKGRRRKGRIKKQKVEGEKVEQKKGRRSKCQMIDGSKGRKIKRLKDQKMERTKHKKNFYIYFWQNSFLLTQSVSQSVRIVLTLVFKTK